MDFVERGEIDTPAVRAYLMEKFAPYLADGRAPTAVVLGCTHYVFLKQTIRSLLPAATLVLDGNEGAVRQLTRRLAEESLLCDASLPPDDASSRYHLWLNVPDIDLARLQSERLLHIPE